MQTTFRNKNDYCAQEPLLFSIEYELNWYYKKCVNTVFLQTQIIHFLVFSMCFELHSCVSLVWSMCLLKVWIICDFALC